MFFLLPIAGLISAVTASTGTIVAATAGGAVAGGIVGYTLGSDNNASQAFYDEEDDVESTENVPEEDL